MTLAVGSDNYNLGDSPCTRKGILWTQDELNYSIRRALDFLKGLSPPDWNRVRPETAALSGADYKKVWKVISGESV